MPSSPRSSRKRVRLRRAIALRVLAVLLGLAVVAAAEVGLRWTGLGNLPDPGDPYVGFSEVRPLFVLNAQGDRYEVPRSRQTFFRPESFAAKKAPREYRIFCLGGSTVQGRPYAIETSFTSWLELSLQAADPGRDWDVVNCGGVSYASYRLLPILKEVLTYEPDLILVYTGHNEFLEDREYGKLKQVPGWVKGVHARISGLRLYGLMWQASSSLRAEEDAERTPLPAEVEAVLDYQDGLTKYHRDDAWRRGVLEHFEFNLRRIVRLARSAEVPLLLINPVSNLRDTPPFKTEPRQDLSKERADEFARLWNEAKQISWTDLDRKAALLREALAIDARHADAHFLLARVHESRGDYSQAKAAYLRAKDEDICPLRMVEPMHEALATVAEQTGTPLIDIRRLIEDESEHSIPGEEWLIDHVHPTIEGHQRIADALFQEMRQMGIVDLQPDWRPRREELYAERFRTLEYGYFPRSVARREALRNWTQGRVGALIAPAEPPREKARDKAMNDEPQSR